MSLLALLYERSRARTRARLLPSGVLLSEQRALQQNSQLRQFLTATRWTPETVVRFENLRQLLQTQPNLLIADDNLLTQNNIPILKNRRDEFIRLYPHLIKAFYEQPQNAGTSSDDSESDEETISATEEEVSATEKDESSYSTDYDTYDYDYSDEDDVEMTSALV